MIKTKEIVRFITGECSQAERDRILEWMRKDSRNRELVEEYQDTWETSGNLELEQDEDYAWQLLSQRIKETTHLVSVRELQKRFNSEVTEKNHTHRIHSFHKNYYQKWLIGISAVIVLALSISFVAFNFNYSNPLEEVAKSTTKEVAVGPGERMNLTFSDGSTVVLNSSSVVRFPQPFNEDSRHVELEGEAFFSVVPEEDSPFIVHANEVMVQVMGTKFNVNSYPEEQIEIVVAEGKVGVHSEAHTKTNEVLLESGDYTVVKQGMPPGVPKKVNLEQYIGWVNGKLVFEAAPLGRVLKKMALYYGYDFQVVDSSLLDRQITASFDKESMAKVLEVLSISLDLEFEKGDSLVVFREI